MSFKEYFLSKISYLSVNFIIYILLSMLFSIAGTPAVILFLVFFIWFMPLIIYIILMFFRERRFYNDIIMIVEKLDKKYLLPEIIKKPNYYEGKIIYDVLKSCNRNMHEYVNVYKNFQEEYREYIEAWVHEIKTPISSLKIMMDNSSSKEKNSIIYEIDKIEQYITQALYYCRSSDVSKDYIVREFSLKDIVNECIRNNRRDFISKRIRVDIENVDVKVIGDSKWIRFILNQIIINSIKYIDSSKGVLKIYTEKDETNVYVSHIVDETLESSNKDNTSHKLGEVDNIEKIQNPVYMHRVNLIIEDNGIGIPKSDLNRVFDKGFTGENGRKYGKSTGIGLYLCKKLCDKMQMGIFLESEAGAGTKVIIKFP